MNHNLESLIAEIRSGFQPKFVFFWGHQPQKDGQIGKGCFSQWWPAPFKLDGVVYQTAEHYMMAEKARLFGDERTRHEILAATHPKQAKALGRKVADFDDRIWEKHRFEIVVRGNKAKFNQHGDLHTFLLATGSRVLVEASPVDKIWGIGLAEDHPDATAPEKWQGLNLLGFALMTVREQLQ